MDEPSRTRLEGVDWATFLPVTRMWGAFRMALHPSKMGLSLVLAIGWYLLWVCLSWFWGPFITANDLWQRPVWMVWAHPWFSLTYLGIGLLITAFVGGAICRFSAIQASHGRAGPLDAAVRFAGRKYVGFVLSPLLPMVVAVVIGWVLVLAGLVFFNVPGLDLVGGVLFGLMLVGGVIVAVLIIGTVLAATLMGPAMAIEGTDAFDVISRTFNYVFGRWWRFLGYELVGLMYGALSFALVSVVLLAGLEITRRCVGWWVFGHEANAVHSWFEYAIYDFPVSRPPRPTGHANPDWMGWTGYITFWMVRIWSRLFMMLLPAFAISMFFSTQTWVYLLLRRLADGTETEHLYLEEQDRSQTEE